MSSVKAWSRIVAAPLPRVSAGVANAVDAVENNEELEAPGSCVEKTLLLTAGRETAAGLAEHRK